MGCEINLLKIVENIQTLYNEREEKGTWLLFIDLKSAFDTVDHALLFEKMKKLEIAEYLIETIQWLYRQTKVKTTNNEVKIGRGCI